MESSTSQEPLRVGIVGTGRIASNIGDEIERGPFSIELPYSHAGAYAAAPATRVVAAADLNPERLAEFARRWNVPGTYHDYREMLAREQLDIVSICTPTRSHLQVFTDICSCGPRAVFLEKPIAISLADADRMIDLADETGLKVAVNHVRTYSPIYRRVRDLVAEGAIGRVRVVTAHWREGLSFGGSHLFDILRFLVNAEPRWVYGHLEPEEFFDEGGSGVIAFADDIEAYVNLRPGHAAPREIDIVGDAGRIRIGDNLAPELHVTDSASPFKELVRRVFPGSVVARSAMTVAVEELVRAVRTGEELASGLRSGRANLEIAVAFHISHAENRVVALPVMDRDLVVDDRWGRS